MPVNNQKENNNSVSAHSAKKVIAEINISNLKYNLSRVKALSKNSKVISVIKANAYGHGVYCVAKALQESDIFAVARFEEAVSLRYFLNQEAIDKPILILEGVTFVEELIDCAHNNFIPNIHCLEQFQTLITFFKQQSQLKLNYWIKVDTGMHRLGLLNDDWKIILDELKVLNNKHLPMGIMSHLACADEKENSFNQQQISIFSDFYNTLNNYTKIDKSLANSAAILSLPETHFDWVRPGIMLYGISPFETSINNRTGLDEKLKPVMTLCSEIITVKALKKGDCIGYGSNWCCPENMTIGIVAIGYGDGYPRHAEAGTPVLLHGIEVPLIGRVSMDMISIDLRYFFHNNKPIEKLTPISIGDKVTLWGEGLPIEKISQKSSSIAYELLCQLTQRVSYKVINTLTDQH